MKILPILFVCLNVWSGSFSQSIKEKLSSALNILEADSQCRHAIIGLYVLDSRNGSVVFNRNAEIGLAPASCQKVITSVTAFELLGHDYTFKTTLSYTGNIDKGLLPGDIIITGSGDPTLGSPRYASTKEERVLLNIKEAIINAGIRQFTGEIVLDNRFWDSQVIPDGWIWQDIGNYYGAGASAINWRENQYDVILKSGNNIGDPVKIVSINPPFIKGVDLINELTSGKKGSGDNAYLYLPVGTTAGYLRGTIPVNEDRFVISGATPNGALQLVNSLYKQLNASIHDDRYAITNEKAPATIFFTHTSPSLDSINYWFLKKSINLYGEALVKTIGYKKTNTGSTDSGINIIKDFWSKRGIEATELNIIDGSGLSPANRVTATSLTTVLRFARQQKWFPSFYNALPEINGIKMKSGSISGVLSYAGYVKDGTGNEYTFAFIINNFNGSGMLAREKIWKVLDQLK